MAWELHLVGTADDEFAAGSAAQTRGRIARRVPRRLAARRTCLELYAQSSLYWHATGFGVDAERHPERLEHFGISTVEAMMYGVVPLVVPAGGQSEIVTDGVNGRHWTTVAELVGATRSLIASPDEWRRLSEAAAKTPCATKPRSSAPPSAPASSLSRPTNVDSNARNLASAKISPWRVISGSMRPTSE